MDWDAAVAPWRRCLVHVLSPRAPSAVVGSVGPCAVSASSFLSVPPFRPFPGCWHLAPSSANSPGFPPLLLCGRAAGMLCWGRRRWISSCFPQIPLAVPMCPSHVNQLTESHTAWVVEVLGLFFLVLLGGRLENCQDIVFNLRFMVTLRILQFEFLIQSSLNALEESLLTMFINPFVCINTNIFHTRLGTLELCD